MNDPSKRKGLGEICSYFIDDLLPYVDVPFPNYGNFTYDQSSSVNSSDFFLPIRLLRGDLYLWRGSLDGNKSDFAKAAQEYRDCGYGWCPNCGSLEFRFSRKQL